MHLNKCSYCVFKIGNLNVSSSVFMYYIFPTSQSQPTTPTSGKKEDTLSTENPPKKKRGRPKGVPNKNRSHLLEVSKSGDDESDDDEEEEEESENKVENEDGMF